MANSGGGSTFRAAISVAVLLGLTACGGSSSTASSEDYPLVEPEPVARQAPIELPNGSVVTLPALPTAHEAEPSPTCERTLVTFQDGSQRPVVIPPAPGLRALAVTERMTRIEWSFHDLPDDCRPVSLTLAVVNGTAPLATPTTQKVGVDGVSGSVEIAYPDFLPPPDVAHASAYAEDGHRSRTVSVLVERPEGTPPDPPEPTPPVTAPAGAPVACTGTRTVVADPAGDVLTYGVGKPPTRVRKLTPALSGIDVTRTEVQIDGPTICAVFTLARPPAGNFGLTLSLVDTTTFACCAALRFRRTAGRLELGKSSVDAQGTYQLEPVDDAGAELRGNTLVITGTLSDDAWDQPKPPATEDIAWSLTTSYIPEKYGPYFGDWVPRHEAVGQPFIRHRDGTTVRLGARR